MNILELIKEANKGSAAAQKCLFDKLSAKMLMLCRRYVKNRQDAEEILLDGFYKFFKNLSTFVFQGDDTLHAWLKKIMVNECLMFLRKKNVFTMATEVEAADLPLEEEALNNLSANDIFTMILQLPVGYRTVFNLYVIEGYEHKEIARMLGISEGTSRSQLSKAKALLQKILLQKGNDYVKRKTR